MKKTMYALSILFLLISICFAPVWANAYSLDALDYNAIIFGDFSAMNSDVEGRLAVGGTATLQNYSVGSRLSTLELADNNDTLIVGGDLSYTNGQVWGNALVGGTATSGFNTLGGTLSHGLGALYIFSTAKTNFENLSTTLGQETANGTTVNNWGSLVLTGDGTSARQIFSVDGTELLNANGISISDIPENASVVINVSGDTSGLTNMGMQSLESIRSNLLFNFYETTALTMSGIGVQGSILAPFADVDANNGQLNGMIVADSWDAVLWNCTMSPLKGKWFLCPGQ
ncbi:choice-of-anchor A family protein [uncultured Desulfobacter sp.]|uniref:choice-of-anchor A family protein n=1 Tax=uncultured Desulfobacter sp. TaxID=240139 RepID=UPI0029F58551|nr:choice-of-anchor A family protein [uncultured Desulfobacter sp.]